MRNWQPELDLEQTPGYTHIVNTLLNYDPADEVHSCTALVISIETDLELLKVQELKVNLSMQNNQTVDTDIYLGPPTLFVSTTGKDKVLKLRTSLYGLKQSPQTFYQHLSQGLQNRGWKPSVIDPCLFMKDHMICVIYMDDTIFAGPNLNDIDRKIKILGIKQDNEEQPLEFRDVGKLSSFILELKLNKDNKINFIYHSLV